MINLKRKRWEKHLACMKDMSNSYKTFDAESESNYFRNVKPICWDNINLDLVYGYQD
jgi:hypothetical protein